MLDPRDAAKRAVSPVTARMDRFLEAIVEHIHAAKEENQRVILAAERQAASRHLELSTRLTQMETEIARLKHKQAE